MSGMDIYEKTDNKPDTTSSATADEGTPGGDDTMARSVQENHSLQAVVELSREIYAAPDIFEVADLGLLNLMGHLGTTSAAIWMASRETELPILLRTFGFTESSIKTVGKLCVPTLCDAYADDAQLVQIEQLDGIFDENTIQLITAAKVSLFGVLCSRGKAIGAIAIIDSSSTMPPADLNMESSRDCVAIASISPPRAASANASGFVSTMLALP